MSQRKKQAPDSGRIGELLGTLLRVEGYASEKEFMKVVIRMQSVFRGAIARKRVEEKRCGNIRTQNTKSSISSAMTIAEQKQLDHDRALSHTHHGGSQQLPEDMKDLTGHFKIQKVMHSEGTYNFESNPKNPFLPWSIKRKVVSKMEQDTGAPGHWDSSAQESITQEKRALDQQIDSLGKRLEKRNMGGAPVRDRSAAASLIALSERNSPRKISGGVGDSTKPVNKTPRLISGAEASKKQTAYQESVRLDKISQEVSALKSDEELLVRGVGPEVIPEAVLTGEESTVMYRTLGDKDSFASSGWGRHKGEIPWATMRRPKQTESDNEQVKRLKEVIGIISKNAHFKFKNVRDAFRLVDVDKSGLVNRQEMSIFVRQFNLPVQYGDLLFDAMDVDNSGYIDYVEFMEHFGPVIQPGCQPFHTYRSPLSRAGQRMFEPNAVGWSLRKLG